MTIGDVIDYIYEWIDFNDTDKKKDHDEPCARQHRRILTHFKEGADMVGRIKGITIEIGGSTKALSTAMRYRQPVEEACF